MYLRGSVFVKSPQKSRNRKIWSTQRFIHIRHHTFHYQITHYLHPKRFVSLPLIFLRWTNITALCSQFFSVRVTTSANSLSSSLLLKLLDYVFILGFRHRTPPASTFVVMKFTYYSVAKFICYTLQYNFNLHFASATEASRDFDKVLSTLF